MKKLPVLFALVLAMLPALPVAVRAEDGVSFSVDSVACRRDHIAEVNVYAQGGGEKPVAALFRFSFDDAFLSFSGVSTPRGAEAEYDAAGGAVTVSYLCRDGLDTAQKATVLTLRFRSLREGEAPIACTVSDCVGADAQLLPVGSVTGGKVTVSGTASSASGSRQTSRTSRSSKAASSGRTFSGEKSARASEASTATGEKTGSAVRDAGSVSNVLQKENNKVLPLVLLCASLVIGGTLIGCILFRVVTTVRRKKRRGPPHDEE